MTDHLSTDERRAMVKASLKELAQKKFHCEMQLVVLRGRSDDVQREFRDALRHTRQGIANLEAEYTDLLAEPVEKEEPQATGGSEADSTTDESEQFVNPEPVIATLDTSRNGHAERQR